MTFTPNMNDGKHIFVFGSNLAGRHGKGAALETARYWGAEQGRGYGPQGQAYAIPTKDWTLNTLSLPFIKWCVDAFLFHATQHTELTFLVTKIGCGLAGYSEDDIRPMFKGAPGNCVLPEGWRDEA